MIRRWLNETPLSRMYQVQLAFCKSMAPITFLLTLACLLSDVPSVSSVPWAVMFGMSSTGWGLFTLLLETQKQIEEYMAEK